jgi:hypothetical protein
LALEALNYSYDRREFDAYVVIDCREYIESKNSNDANALRLLTDLKKVHHLLDEEGTKLQSVNNMILCLKRPRNLLLLDNFDFERAGEVFCGVLKKLMSIKEGVLTLVMTALSYSNPLYKFSPKVFIFIMGPRPSGFSYILLLLSILFNQCLF